MDSSKIVKKLSNNINVIGKPNERVEEEYKRICSSRSNLLSLSVTDRRA
jgi:hypothetical protein